jgi:hypothetical protein
MPAANDPPLAPSNTGPASEHIATPTRMTSSALPSAPPPKAPDFNARQDVVLLLVSQQAQHLLSNSFPAKHVDQQYAAQAAQAAFPHSPSSIAVYFHLHPISDVQSESRRWVSTLTSVSLAELRQLATSKFPGTIARWVEGIIKEASA